MDEALASCLIDSLTILSKYDFTKTSTLKFVNTNESYDILESLRQGITPFVSADDITSVNDFWSAIIMAYEGSPLLSPSSVAKPIETIVNPLPDYEKRAYAALMCTVESIVESHTQHTQNIILSLYKALISPKVVDQSASTSFLLKILTEYKVYFPYSYSFARRLSKTPHVPIQKWYEFLFSTSLEDSTDSNLLTSPAANPTSDILDDWDLSGLEEGEDSDNAEAVPLRRPKKKKMTRMSKAKKSPKKTKKPDTTEDSDILDIPTLEDISNIDDDVAELSAADEEVTNEDLQKAYDNSIDKITNTAQCQKLIRQLKYSAGTPLLAEKVAAFGDTHISYKALLVLAKPFLRREESKPVSSVSVPETAVPLSITAASSLTNSALSITPSTPKAIDSSSIVVKTAAPASPAAAPPRIYIEDGVQDPVAVGESLFRQIDRNNDGVVSQVELVKALRTHTEIATRLRLPTNIRQEDGTRDAFVRMFHDIDSDDSGNISLNEFTSYLRRHCYQQDSHDFRRDDAATLRTASTRSISSTTTGASGWVSAKSSSKRDVWADSPLISQSLLREDTPPEVPVSIQSTPTSIVTSAARTSPDRSVRSPPPIASPPRQPSPTRAISDPTLTTDKPPLATTKPIAVKTIAVRTTPVVDTSPVFPTLDTTPSPGSDDSKEDVDMSTALVVKPNTPAPKHSDPLKDRSALPPLHKSDSFRTSPTPQRQTTFSTISSTSQEIPTQISPPMHLSCSQEFFASLPEYTKPPSESEFGTATKALLEGWLEKKSTFTGLYQKRYFVLAHGFDSTPESPTIELRVFGKAVDSAWGFIPIQLKRVISIDSIESVTTVSNKKKIESVFTVTERTRSVFTRSSSGPVATTPPDPASPRDEAESVCSDDYWNGKSRILTLRAENPQARLLWTSTLEHAVEIVAAGSKKHGPM